MASDGPLWWATGDWGHRTVGSEGVSGCEGAGGRSSDGVECFGSVFGWNCRSFHLPEKKGFV